MGKETKIKWCSATQNFWVGCHKKSPGCSYCYMDRWANRTGRDPENVTRTEDATFYAPLKWKEPKIIFTCSLSDFFIKEADAWRADATKVMEQTPQHTYLILTKEIDRAVGLGYVPPKNAIIGVSAENQHWFDKRVPMMFHVPARGYFISAEPLLGPLSFGSWLNVAANQRVRCVITGGESGGTESRMLVNKLPITLGERKGVLEYIWAPKPLAHTWIDSIMEQCDEAGVTFFHKQWGGPRPDSGGHLIGGKSYQSMDWAKL